MKLLGFSRLSLSSLPLWCWLVSPETYADGFVNGHRRSRSFGEDRCWLLQVVPRDRTGAATADASRTLLRFSSNDSRDERGKASAATAVSRPDPSVLLSARDDVTQRLGFGAIVVGLAMGTYACVQVLALIENLLPTGWFDAWRYYTWTLPMGAIFVLAGITHFAFKDTYAAFVPPPGTWGGLWQIPAPGAEKLGLTYEEYHSYWTGVAEVGGGLLLILSGFPFDMIVPTPLPASLLFLLTVAVTPANIYMFTHDVQPPRLPPIPYPEGHAFRGLMQCVLLSIFWKLSFQ
jgi:uncharacterized membrane protein